MLSRDSFFASTALLLTIIISLRIFTEFANRKGSLACSFGTPVLNLVLRNQCLEGWGLLQVREKNDITCFPVVWTLPLRATPRPSLCSSPVLAYKASQVDGVYRHTWEHE